MRCFVCNRRVHIDFLREEYPQNMTPHGPAHPVCYAAFRELRRGLKEIPEKELEGKSDL